TLVEILVVVAILAVLAAIVYVLMSPAREKGRQTSCISNLRQIGVAVAMYRSDYEGTRGEGRASSGSGSNIWVRLGVPPLPFALLDARYVTNKRIFECPHDPEVKRVPRRERVFSYSWCPLPCTFYPDMERAVPCEASNRLYREKGERMVLALDENHWYYHYYSPSDPLEKRLKLRIGMLLRLDGSVERRNLSDIPPRTQGGSCGF
ncbi:MAG: type II secretion system protein, partial [Fimbriimonadia bacterium]